MLKRFLAVSMVVMMLFSTGCGGGQPTKTENAGDTTAPVAVVDEGPKEVVIGIAGDAYSLDPYPLNETITHALNMHMFESLVTMNRNIEIEPLLAASWEVSDDAKVWTFKLREGVKFSNGNVFDADDVVYSYTRAKSPMSAFKGMLSTVETIEAVDPYTVKLTLNQPNVILLSQIMDVVIMDKENCDGKSDEEIALIPVGTGQYILEEHVREDKLVFARNENYWGEKPEATKATYKIITNEGTRTANILSGAVDMITDVPVRDTQIIETNKTIKILSQAGLRNIYLNMAGWTDTPSVDAAMPLKSPDGSNPMKDVRVREAMYRAIDEETIIKQVMNGFASPAATYIPEGFNGYNGTIERLSFDPAKAEELLDAAGYPRLADGYRFELTLDASNDRYVNDGDIATAIAGYFEKVGIKTNLNLMSRTVFFTYIGTANKTGDSTHLCMTGWADGSGESTLFGMDLLYSTTQAGPVKPGFGGVNRGYYLNENVDALIDKAMGTIDATERDAIMQEAWKIASDEVSYIPLHFEQDVYAVSDRITYSPRFNKFVFAWDVAFNK